jgi:uncharacterized protein YdaU (DUF1376 family)
MHLNAEKHGAYLLLLMHLWRAGFLVDNADQLASIARCDAKTWAKSVWPTLISFFDLHDGKFYQKRLMAERENATKLRDIRSKVGKKGAAKRWQDDGKSDGKSMTNACQNDGPSPSPSPSPLPNNSPTESSVALSAPPAPRAKIGRRLADDWSPSAEDRHFASDLGLNTDAVASKVRDYWRSVSGAKATKTDWSATWRNWCRNESERRPAARASPTKPAFRNGFAEMLHNDIGTAAPQYPRNPASEFLEHQNEQS